MATISYFPYGVTRLETGTLDTDKLFTGQRLDDTGLYFYGARYYDATIGRFISPDSIVPNPANPQCLNRYSYCVNNPLKYIDPSGRLFGVTSDYLAELVSYTGAVFQAVGSTLSGNPQPIPAPPKPKTKPKTKSKPKPESEPAPPKPMYTTPAQRNAEHFGHPAKPETTSSSSSSSNSGGGKKQKNKHWWDETPVLNTVVHTVEDIVIPDEGTYGIGATASAGIGGGFTGSLMLVWDSEGDVGLNYSGGFLATAGANASVGPQFQHTNAPDIEGLEGFQTCPGSNIIPLVGIERVLGEDRSYSGMNYYLTPLSAGFEIVHTTFEWSGVWVF